MKTTVFVIDDDPSVLRSLSRLLSAEGIHSECFGSAAAYLAREAYDGVGCILLDINMPGTSGIELQAEFLEHGHDLPIVFLTGHGNVSNSVMAMKRGAFDFLTKPADEVYLLRSVRRALNHHREAREVKETRNAILNRIESLTSREREVMECLITGAPNKRVAGKLQISVKTVKVHRAHVMEKMGIRSAAELLHLCHLAGIEPDVEI